MLGSHSSPLRLLAGVCLLLASCGGGGGGSESGDRGQIADGTPTPGVPLPTATPAPRAALEAGFPAQAFHFAGTRFAPLFPVVGDIDGQAGLEILYYPPAAGPLYAWHADGTPVQGWAERFDAPTHGAPSLGNLSRSAAGLEVVTGHWGTAVEGAEGSAWAYLGNGEVLPGWPIETFHVTDTVALADLDGDAVDEIFFTDSNAALNAYDAVGQPLPGWPAAVPYVTNSEWSAPAIGDLDGNGTLELVVNSLSLSGAPCFSDGARLMAFDHTGAALPDFPAHLRWASRHGPILADLDGDGTLEILVNADERPDEDCNGLPDDGTGAPGVRIGAYSHRGELVRSFASPTANVYNDTAGFAVADLDGDGLPEVLLHSDGRLDVWHGDGSLFPGFPATWGGGRYETGSSAPVVGDVDGDSRPEIVFTSHHAYDWTHRDSALMVFDANGSYEAYFPELLPIGWGGTPAIADIDLDGRNEIIVIADRWDGVEEPQDMVWVFEIETSGPHGAIEWGQLGGGARHQRRYPVEE